MNISFVPLELRKFNHFVYYVDSKKIPMNPNFRVQKKARANDPSSWSSFSVVKNVIDSGRGLGVGFFFDDDDPFVGIDLDHVVDKNGELDPVAVTFLDEFPNTYVELSMSGTGIHLIIKANLPKSFLGSNTGGRKIDNVEFYTAKHYLALTGIELFAGSLRDPTVIDDVSFENFLRRVFPNQFKSEYESEKIIRPENGKSIFDSPDYLPEYDDELIRWLCEKVPKFRNAYEFGSASDFNGDKSRRDFFIMTQLLSLFHGDADRAVKAFYNSACLTDADRKSGHVEDYLNRTYTNAVDRWNGFTYDIQITSKRKSLEGEFKSNSVTQEKKHVAENTSATIDESTKSDQFDRDKNSVDIPTIYNVPEIEEEYTNFVSSDEYFQNTDRQNAKIFVNCNNREIRFCIDMFQHGAFYLWSGSIWKCLNSSVQCWNLIDSMFPVYREMWLSSKSESERKSIASARHRIEMASGVESCLSWVRADSRIQIKRDELNKCTNKLCFRNGVYDLESNSFNSADPADLFTLCVGYDFNSSVTSNLWLKTISEIIPDKDTRSALQTFLGLCLSGDIDSEKFAYFYGVGGNGKGTIIRTIVEALGDFASIIPIDLFVQKSFSFGAESATPQLAKLEYARLAVADEIPDESLLINAKLKSLTGGDHITVRPLYSPPITFTPQFKLILSGNVKAGFVGKKDIGIDRRLLFFPFEQTFNNTNSNRYLKRELTSTRNLQGVMNWLIEGFQRYKQIGLFESRKMRLARENYLETYEDADPDVMNFVENYCILDTKSRCPRAEFLTTFRQIFPTSKLLDKQLFDILFGLYPDLKFLNYGGSKVIAGLRIKNQHS